MKVNRLALLVGAVATATVLTGCAPTGHTAIKVGGTSYSDSDVNLLTSFECTIAKDPSASLSLSRQTARAFMATILVASAVDHEVAVKAKIKTSPGDATSTMAQLDPYIKKAVKGKKDQARLHELVQDSVLGQAAVGTLVQTTLGQSLAQMDQQQAQQVISDGINQVRVAEAKRLKMEIDPAFGLSSNGLEPAKSDPSLSTALSSFAKSAAADQPKAAWLETLPTTQKCG